MRFKTDFKKCIGCEACVVACNQVNNGAHFFRKVIFINANRLDGMPQYSVSVSCNHCEKPKCLEACKNDAYYIKDGRVLHNSDKCEGCKDCISACPYEAISFSNEDNLSKKCNFCDDKLKKDEKPFCVRCCPTGALELTDEGGYNDSEKSLDMIFSDMEKRKAGGIV